ncbi:Dystroglycan 1 [Acropora cervicornis]|uniref:Dystroglycan 1 n=1 Tax=Acropora cervicornis TaxID=6130 RepID=A0AAD9QUY2_ACRCE|nr:Dystroglycan 1 [Acropora cervicornis]
MSKALAVLKLFFSLISVNSTESPSSASNTTSGVTRSALAPTSPVPYRFFKGKATATVGQPFRISITQDSVEGSLHSDISKLRFEMKTFHYGDIRSSSWIQFDKARREVYGFPLPGNVGRFFFKFIVSDSIKSSLLDMTFELRVHENGFAYSHEVDFKMATEFDYLKFMTNVHIRFDFANRLARYCFNERPTTIWIKTFKKNPKALTVVFVNIPYSPCLETTYRKLNSKLVDKKSNITANFERAMSETFPIKSAKFRFFGACDPGLFDPEPPFEWGWLKHVIPLAMIFTVVGIPVAISCYVNKRRRKPQVVEERRRRTLRPRQDYEADFTSHTVHFNNRYPSMLSVTNNSKEDNVGDEDKVHSSKSNIPNGSPASGRHLTVPNGSPSRPKQGANSTTANTANNKKNPFKFASNEERANFDVRAMWDDDDDDDDDTEPTPLNMPSYYTQKKNDSAQEEQSMMGAVLDMNFSNIAENISTKLKGVKSMLNVHSETAAQETNLGPRLTTKLKGLGKSMLNLSTTANDTSEIGTSYGEPSAPSLSTKLRDFGKSMLNITVSEENDDKRGYSEMPRAPYQDFEDNVSEIYKPTEKYNYQAKRRSWPNAEQGYDDILRYGARQRYDSVRHDDNYTRQSYENAYQHFNREGHGYDNYRRVYDDAKQSYGYPTKDVNHPRMSYDDSRRGNHEEHQQHDFQRESTSQYGNRRNSNRRYSGDTSESELVQYNFPSHRRSPSLEYLMEERDGYCPTPELKRSVMQRKWSREHDFDEYSDSLFEASSVHSLKSEHEKSIFDTDYCEAEDENALLVKPTPVRRLSPVKNVRGEWALTQAGMNDKSYKDNTNPQPQANGQANGPTRISQGKSLYNVNRTSSISSQSTLEFWDDQEFNGTPEKWNLASNKTNEASSSFRSTVPADPRRENYKGNIPNGTKPQSKAKHTQGNSIRTGDLLPGEKPPMVFTLGDSDEEEYKQRNQKQRHEHQQQNNHQQQQPENKNSLVGLIKTGVNSILEPDGNMSKWLSGIQKNDSSVT